eukprot:TRINITY_DN11546_c0_g1_i1.p2 TRINITY_DN11546_c0_g1~~TRINITY_DN11546_c0_g1_i1.p2  ORF type:complete len:288 (+),score=37.20 TRINITY_DN11546_c0_g1_i1:49-864(+)
MPSELLLRLLREQADGVPVPAPPAMPRPRTAPARRPDPAPPPTERADIRTRVVVKGGLLTVSVSARTGTSWLFVLDLASTSSLVVPSAASVIWARPARPQTAGSRRRPEPASVRIGGAVVELPAAASARPMPGLPLGVRGVLGSDFIAGACDAFLLSLGEAMTLATKPRSVDDSAAVLASAWGSLAAERAGLVEVAAGPHCRGVLSVHARVSRQRRGGARAGDTGHGIICEYCAGGGGRGRQPVRTVRPTGRRRESRRVRGACACRRSAVR